MSNSDSSTTTTVNRRRRNSGSDLTAPSLPSSAPPPSHPGHHNRFSSYVSATSSKTTQVDDSAGSEKAVQSKRITYTKTSCYFCNEWVDSERFKDHLPNCSQTLVECPHRCRSYVKRSLLADHLQLCPRSPANGSAAGTPLSHQHHDSPYSESSASGHSPAAIAALLDRLQLLDADLNAVRSALQEETRQRHKLILDVGALRKRHALEDEWTLKVGSLLTALKRCLGEESSARCTDVLQLRSDIGRLHDRYEESTAWRSEVRDQLDRLEREMLPEVNGGGGEGGEMSVDGTGSSWRTYIDVLMTDQRETAMRVFELENEISLLRQSNDDASRLSATNEALLTERFARLDELINAQQQQLALQLNSQPPLPKTESSQLNGRTSAREATGRAALRDFELAQLKHICTGAEDRCDRLAQHVKAVRQQAAQTAQRCDERLAQASMGARLAAIQSTDGHLVWRIGDFAAKMQAARDGVLTELHSPLFSDRRYGYTLRLDVHLDGMGTWRGRNVLACLSVVAGGEWDALLRWPCKLRADLRLREQPDGGGAAGGTVVRTSKEGVAPAIAGDVCKTIVAKGTVDAYEQAQYIFITHKQLKRGRYVKDDAVFFEVRVRREEAADGVVEG